MPRSASRSSSPPLSRSIRRRRSDCACSPVEAWHHDVACVDSSARCLALPHLPMSEFPRGAARRATAVTKCRPRLSHGWFWNACAEKWTRIDDDTYRSVAPAVDDRFQDLRLDGNPRDFSSASKRIIDRGCNHRPNASNSALAPTLDAEGIAGARRIFREQDVYFGNVMSARNKIVHERDR